MSETVTEPVQPARGKAEPKPPRSARPPHQVLERLFQLYPAMFGARFLPLKLGVFQELLARHPGEFSKDELKAALGVHARSTRYLESVATGQKRHGLDGVAVEDVAPEHVHHAIMEVFRRRQARSKEDLRPWLHSRLIEAIQACGLSRDAYLERVHAQDELTLAALQEAFEQLAQQAAKSEALLRAYQASGCGVDEFAAMYGLDPAVVSEAVKRAA